MAISFALCARTPLRVKKCNVARCFETTGIRKTLRYIYTETLIHKQNWYLYVFEVVDYESEIKITENETVDLVP